MVKDRENLEELGCNVLMMIDCRWSNEEWDYIGVEEWPTIEALESEPNSSLKNYKNSGILNRRLI
ncbi:MAG TPA: hypothetical protein ENG51_20755 [Deltaproteobacteria bacterium]|nr:hypothetical protein [Deltaproteobacteria bacterium]